MSTINRRAIFELYALIWIRKIEFERIWKSFWHISLPKLSEGNRSSSKNAFSNLKGQKIGSLVPKYWFRFKNPYNFKKLHKTVEESIQFQESRETSETLLLAILHRLGRYYCKNPGENSINVSQYSKTRVSKKCIISALLLARVLYLLLGFHIQ